MTEFYESADSPPEGESSAPEKETLLKRLDWKGCWVTFVDVDDLPRAAVKTIRRAFGSSSNDGEAGHIGLDEALTVLIEGWHIQDSKGNTLELQVPRYARRNGSSGNPLDKIPAGLGAALESHISPVLQAWLRGAKVSDDGEPGGPHRPGQG